MVQDQIREALDRGLTIEICYVKYNGERTIRIISDIHYSKEFGPTHIEAYCHTRNENRTFKIERIISVKNAASPAAGATNGKYQFNPNKKIFNLYGV